MVKQINSSVKDENLIRKRRAQLQKGAVKLFKEKGFHKATTREIAQAAGFSIGTLYEYIRTKEDVLFLVCDAIYDEVKSRMEALIDPSATSEEAVFQVMKSYFELMDDMQDELLILYQELKVLSKEAKDYVFEKEKAMVRIIEKVIQNNYPHLNEKELKIISNNVVIQGQMWAFRRWLIQKEFHLEEYTKIQFDLLIRQTRQTKNVY